jgi:hypothetical protein
VWAIAVLGLWLTIKPAYRRTFWSTETGYAYCQNLFLGNEEDDAKRAQIFYMNERQWRAIRDRVRQWVLSTYSTWEALKPAWFNDTLKALIPDSFIPAEALQQENARVPSGRRRTIDDMAIVRRMSLAVGSASESVPSESNADAAGEIAELSPEPMARMGDGDVAGTAHPFYQQHGRAGPPAPAATTTAASEYGARNGPDGEDSGRSSTRWIDLAARPPSSAETTGLAAGDKGVVLDIDLDNP